MTVNGAAGAPSRKLRAGRRRRLDAAAPVATDDRAAEAIPLTIVHEDRWLVVIDKPAGLVVHPAPGHEAGTLVNALLAHCHDLRGIGGELRPGIVHRIDKDTSGLLVVAKDDATMNGAGGGVQGAHGRARVRRAGGGQAARRRAGASTRCTGAIRATARSSPAACATGKRAVTNWRVVERFAGAARIEARLETGRTHQVRVHMAALGCPLLGDRDLRAPPREPARARHRRARWGGRRCTRARWRSSTRRPASGWRSPSELPPDMQAALAALRGAAE